MRWMFPSTGDRKRIGVQPAADGVRTMGMYGSSSSTYVKYFTDSLWAEAHYLHRREPVADLSRL